MHASIPTGRNKRRPYPLSYVYLTIDPDQGGPFVLQAVALNTLNCPGHWGKGFIAPT